MGTQARDWLAIPPDDGDDFDQLSGCAGAAMSLLLAAMVLAIGGGLWLWLW